MSAELEIIRTAEGIATVKEAWAVELAEPEKAEREKEKEIEDYISRLVESNYKRLAQRARLLMEQALRVQQAKKEVQEQPQEVSSELEKQFEALAQEWLSETGFLSDPVRKLMHPAHLKIIGMGEKVLPLILREVQKMSGHWFVALNAISPEIPVKPEDETSLERVANAWLEWGKEKGLI